jgi:hypothetical protein
MYDKIVFAMNGGNAVDVHLELESQPIKTVLECLCVA